MGADNDSITRDLAKLEGLVSEGFRDIKGSMEKLDIRLRSLEQSHSAVARVEGVRLDNVEEDVDKLEKRVECIEKILPTLQNAVRVFVFLGSALGVSILALIWSLITGQAVLTLK